ncbi:hypothetical protein FACS189450_11640 [Spirochaetia bacterium]|nr:hypothetical protein FACS189450_11640 [Spirochaetia bacterium]
MNSLQSSLNTNAAEKGKMRLIHENLLKRLPPDILREMARRQLEEIKKAGYDVAVANVEAHGTER